MIRHLDNEYNRHYLTFALRDGRILSSRDVNWHEVPLHDIEAITLSIRGQGHTLRRADYATFVEFLHFRTEGTISRFVDGVFIPEHVREWVIGWTDGQREYCQVVDFATGVLKEQREFERNRALFPSHFHPQSKTGGVVVIGV